MEDDMIEYGTPEHAADVTQGRHPGIRDGLQWLTPAHLPLALRRYSEPFYDAAVTMLKHIPTDSPELTTALNGLIAAKDSAIRAGIRHDTGRAGSVPRPQQVTEPPQLDGADRLTVYADTEVGQALAHKDGMTTADLPPFGPDQRG